MPGDWRGTGRERRAGAARLRERVVTCRAVAAVLVPTENNGGGESEGKPKDAGSKEEVEGRWPRFGGKGWVPELRRWPRRCCSIKGKFAGSLRLGESDAEIRVRTS